MTRATKITLLETMQMNEDGYVILGTGEMYDAVISSDTETRNFGASVVSHVSCNPASSAL